MLVTKEEEENSFWIFSLPVTQLPHPCMSKEGIPYIGRSRDIYKNIYSDFWQNTGRRGQVSISRRMDK